MYSSSSIYPEIPNLKGKCCVSYLLCKAEGMGNLLCISIARRNALDQRVCAYSKIKMCILLPDKLEILVQLFSFLYFKIWVCKCISEASELLKEGSF